MTDLPVSITKYVDGQIYEAFSAFEGQRNITVSAFLKELNIEKIIKQHKHVKFSDESRVKSMIFMILKGIKFQSQLAYYLRRKANKQDAINLGFDYKAPNQRTFSYYKKHVLDTDAETNLAIGYIARKVEEISGKFGIIFDIETIQIKKLKGVCDKTKYNKRLERYGEWANWVIKNVCPQIRLQLRHNAKYKPRKFHKMLVNMSKERSTAERFWRKNNIHVADAIKKGVEEKDLAKIASPIADTLLYHLKKNDKEGIHENFTKINDYIFNFSKSSGVFNSRPVTLAIDYTGTRYYGKSKYMIIKSKKNEEQRYPGKYFKYATSSIVEPGRLFTLSVLPINVFSSQKDILKTLIEDAKKKMRINCVVADRAFSNIDNINLMNDLGVNFIMLMRWNTKLAKLLENPIGSVIDNYVIGDYDRTAVVNLVISETYKGKRVAIATNMKIEGGELVSLYKNYHNTYKKRWGIEISYKNIKLDFLPKTTSNNYRIRFFYFLLSVLLYNSWILIDIITTIETKGIIEENRKHEFWSYEFMEILYSIISDLA